MTNILHLASDLQRLRTRQRLNGETSDTFALRSHMEAHCGEIINALFDRAYSEKLLKETLAAIETGRSEPLFIVRDAIRNWLDAYAQGGVTEGGDGEAGSVSEANSTRSRSDAPNPFNSDPADNHSHRDNIASGKGIDHA